MAGGAFWMVLFKLVERSLGLISMLILVRLLSPVDFGTVAMAMSFIVMAELLAAFGFDVALIQMQDTDEDHYHTAWTFNFLLGLTITILMLAAATGIASFYKHPEVFWVVCALSLGPLITGCENIGVVAFRKDMQFRREFVFQLSRKIIGFMVVVPLAYYLHSYWALVAGILSAKLAGTITSYLAHPFRPRFSLSKASGLMNFSKWLLMNNIVGFLKERSSDFFIGRMLGAAPLGLYNISYEVALMPTTELSAPINRALLPGFAKIAKDPEAMRAAYANAIGMLVLLAVPAAAGIFAVAPFFVPVLLGTKWLASIPLMEILSFNGGILMFHSSICTVLIANGHPDRVTRTNGLFVLLLFILLGLLIPAYGLNGAAFAALGASILTTPIYLAEIRRSLDVPVMQFVRVAARPITAAAVMAALVRWVLPDWTPEMNLVTSIGWLFGGVSIGVLAYASVIMLLWQVTGRPAGAEKVLFDRIRARIVKGDVAPASKLS